MKFPTNFLGWTFAQDFLRSKTTHLAFTTIVAAITAVANHRLPPAHAALAAIGSLAVAFLRDSQAKHSQEIADLLFEGLHLAHLDDAEIDGEADAPQPPAPLTDSLGVPA